MSYKLRLSGHPMYSKDIVMQTGYLIMMILNWLVDMYVLLEAVVSWKYQANMLAKSTKKLSYYLREGNNWSRGLRNLLNDIPMCTKLGTSIYTLWLPSCYSSSKNKLYINKNRHNRRRHNIMRQLIEDGAITLDIVKSKQNLVNPLTKGL